MKRITAIILMAALITLLVGCGTPEQKAKLVRTRQTNCNTGMVIEEQYTYGEGEQPTKIEMIKKGAVEQIAYCEYDGESNLLSQRVEYKTTPERLIETTRTLDSEGRAIEDRSVTRIGENEVTAVVKYEYTDENGSYTAIQYAKGIEVMRASYTLNEHGDITEICYNGKDTVRYTYTYDEESRITEMKQYADTVAVYTYEYREDSKIKKETFYSGGSAVYEKIYIYSDEEKAD